MREERTSTSERPVSSISLCMGHYLCFEPVSRLLCVSMRLAWAVTSALASHMSEELEVHDLPLSSNF